MQLRKHTGLNFLILSASATLEKSVMILLTSNKTLWKSSNKLAMTTSMMFQQVPSKNDVPAGLIKLNMNA
jgi:hypothetical protein